MPKSARGVVEDVVVLPKGRSGLAAVPLNGDRAYAAVANALVKMTDLPLLNGAKLDIG